MRKILLTIYILFLCTASYATVDSNTVVIDMNNERVGVGTISPSEKLDVNGRIIDEGTFANIHVHDAGATPQDIPTGAGYTKVTGFSDNDGSANCTPDVANDKITFTKTGFYAVSHNSSFTGDTNNVVYFVAAFLDGAEQNQCHFVRKLATAGDVGSASFSCIVDVTTASIDLDVRVRHNNMSTVEYTMEYANLTVVYLGET